MQPFTSPLSIDSLAPSNVCSHRPYVYWKGVSELSGVIERIDIHSKPSTNARLEEIKRLTNNGTYEMVDIFKVTKDTHVFGSCFVDLIMPSDIGSHYKSRGVAQNYGDDHAATNATKSRTVERLTLRLFMSMSTSLEYTNTHIRYITQANIQSDTPTERDVYIKPPNEMSPSSNKVLKVTEPFYGIPVSELYWYLIYASHHISSVEMQLSKVDRCLLCKENGNMLESTVILQVDESVTLAPMSS